MRLDFSSTVKRDLQIIAGNRCMICTCPTTKPRIAHIIPASENGPRCEYRSQYTNEFITSPANGLSLCNKCHDDVDDKDLNTYSIEELFKINNQFREKFQIEEEYRRLLGVNEFYNHYELDEFYKLLIERLDITDEEIESLIAKHNDFEKIDFISKMEKNNLTFRQRRKIKQLYAAELFILKEQLEENPIIAIKIGAAVRVLYGRLNKNNIEQAKIYDKMLEHMYDPSKKIIGNEIMLTYYFIICEVFKR